MYLLYELLLSLGFLSLLPRFAVDALRKGPYTAGLGQRLGSIPFLSHSERPVLWLHCVSECGIDRSHAFVSALRASHPAHILVISAITVKGFKHARKVYGQDAATVFYFPIDLRWSVRRALHRIRPTIVLLAETELWPRFLRECCIQQVPVVVIHGRISPASFNRYSYRLVR